jgi:proteasome lid subunit RPN8/RPN11
MNQLPQALLMSDDARHRILAHAHLSLPMEAVGLLGGDERGMVMEVIPLTNVAGRGRFLADPLEQFEAERFLQSRNLLLLAVYHSHPGGGAQLSETDCSFACELSAFQVIVALARRHRQGDEIKAFRIIAGRPVPVRIRMV